MKHSTIVTALLISASLATAFVIGGCTRGQSGSRPPLPVIQTLPAFTLTDQDVRPVDLESLKGHPFIINFMFTSCTDFCGVMTAKMREVRAALGPGSPIRTVSISVDPDTDRPTRLKKYAASQNATDPSWLFLTGERRVIGTIMQTLYLAPSGDPEKLSPTQHSSRFVLVDAQGRVRGYYEYDDNDARKRLVSDAKALEAKEIE